MRDRSFLFAAFLVVVAAVLVVIIVRGPGEVTEAGDDVVVAASIQLDQFGLSKAQYQVSESVVRRNQTFSDLLTPHDVDYERIVNLAREQKDVFDVRRLKTGRPYYIYSDSLGTARFMVYEKDRTSYVVFDLGEEPTARIGERRVSVRVKDVQGTINNSLYMTLVEQGIHPTVANRMSEVFAWQIDFTRIQKGDAFRIIFEEDYVDNERVGMGEILAARFVHQDSDFYAFHYKNGDVDEHYDENGKSLRKAFLMAPVEFKRISSSFSRSRFHPVQKRYKAHLGTDYAADRGTPIQATGDGVVTEARYGQYNGNYVKIRHNGTYTTQYLHMSKIGAGMRPGKVVKQGDTIGYVGSTGLATGNHVCYRFWKNGQQVDHRREKFPSVGPVPVEFASDFDLVRDDYLVLLSNPIDPTVDMTYARLLETPAAITTP